MSLTSGVLQSDRSLVALARRELAEGQPIQQPAGTGVPTGTRVTDCDDVSIPSTTVMPDSHTSVIIWTGAGVGGAGAGAGAGMLDSAWASGTVVGTGADVDVAVLSLVTDSPRTSTFTSWDAGFVDAPDEATTATPVASTAIDASAVISTRRDGPRWFPATADEGARPLLRLSTVVVHVDLRRGPHKALEMGVRSALIKAN
jgi:hypothetical protein